MSLEPSDKDEDVGLFMDARTGFSHLIPGRPRIEPEALGCDAVVRLQDAPITIRYSLEPPQLHARSAEELARLTAHRFGSLQARAPVNVESTHPTWLASWGVEAAAVAAYDVAAAEREDLFVLVRQGLVTIVTWTYDRAFTFDPAYASFAAVAEATMVWDPLRWEQRGRVWPESAFIGSGLSAKPKPKYNETARRVARGGVSELERVHALVVLASIISGAGAPWVVLRPEFVEANRQAILSMFEDDEVRQAIDNAFFEVRTAHDLRGLAILLGRALEVARPR